MGTVLEFKGAENVDRRRQNKLSRVRRALARRGYLLLSHRSHGEHFYYLVPHNNFSPVDIDDLARRLGVDDFRDTIVRIRREALIKKMERGDDDQAMAALIEFREWNHHCNISPQAEPVYPGDRAKTWSTGCTTDT